MARTNTDKFTLPIRHWPPDKRIAHQNVDGLHDVRHSLGCISVAMLSMKLQDAVEIVEHFRCNFNPWHIKPASSLQRAVLPTCPPNAPRDYVSECSTIVLCSSHTPIPKTIRSLLQSNQRFANWGASSEKRTAANMPRASSGYWNTMRKRTELPLAATLVHFMARTARRTGPT